jgi:uncharacterized membrane protein
VPVHNESCNPLHRTGLIWECLLQYVVVALPEDTLVRKILAAFFEPEFPPDLTLCGLWLAAGTLAIYVPVLRATPLNYLLAIPVLLFISGYCILAALFPKNDDIGLTERIALSFGLSIVLAALIGTGFLFTTGETQMDPVALISILVADVMILIAFFRRAFLPTDQRFKMPFSEIRTAIHEGLFPPESTRTDQILSIILILTITVAITATIYVIASPKESEHFSEFYILGEKRMADDYPNQIIEGLSYPMFIGVGNHEYRNMSYTIETWAMKTEFDTVTNTSRVITMDPLDHQSLVLSHNETKEIPYYLSVRKPGYNRIEFLLFNETIPGPDVQGSNRINASYRDLYLRVTVI